MLTLQVKSHSQAEKKGASSPARQQPATLISVGVVKSNSTQQQGAEKVSLQGPFHFI